MRPEDVAKDFELDVWPDNWQAVEVFVEMSTQWRVGMGGPTGLDYGPVFHRLERLGLSGGAWEAMFDDIRTLEAAALEQMRKDAKRG